MDNHDGAADCGCTVRVFTESRRRIVAQVAPEIVRCPMHALAPDLLAFVKNLERSCRNPLNHLDEDALAEVCRHLIAKAEVA